MSDLWTPDLDRQVTLEKVEKPASRWRNKWRARGEIKSNQEHRTAGEIYWGLRIWPSKETAEQCAIDDETSHPTPLIEYLGAFPVEGEA